MATRYKRKNLMVDQESLTRLARQRGTSESEAVREAVRNELAVEEAMMAWDAICESGGLADPDSLLGRD